MAQAIHEKNRKIPLRKRFHTKKFAASAAVAEAFKFSLKAVGECTEGITFSGALIFDFCSAFFRKLYAVFQKIRLFIAATYRPRLNFVAGQC